MVGTGAFTMTSGRVASRRCSTANPTTGARTPTASSCPTSTRSSSGPSPTCRPVGRRWSRAMPMSTWTASARTSSSGGPTGSTMARAAVVPDPARETTYLLHQQRGAAVRQSRTCDERWRCAPTATSTSRSGRPATRSRTVRSPEGSLGYLEDPGFPGFDADAGNASLDQIGRPAEMQARMAVRGGWKGGGLRRFLRKLEESELPVPPLQREANPQEQGRRREGRTPVGGNRRAYHHQNLTPAKTPSSRPGLGPSSEAKPACTPKTGLTTAFRRGE